MKTLIEILQKQKYGTDKHTDHHYIQDFYEEAFSKFQSESINFLEIGVWNGESCKLWSDYFTNANIIGIDIFTRTSIEQVKKNLQNYKVNLYKLNSANCSDLEFTKFCEQYPIKFSIVIDDGDHSANAQIKTFNRFKSLVKSEGLYIIEDIADHNVEIIQKNIPEVKILISNGQKYKSKFGIINF